MKKDQVIGAISVLCGLVFGYMTSLIPDSNMVGDPGSRIFPYIACVLFLICGIGLLITGAKKEDEGPFLAVGQWIRLAAMLGCMIVYYFLFEIIGFIPLSVVLLFAVGLLFAEGENVPWWKNLIFAVIVTIFLYFTFGKLLSVPLPMGFLG